jgi:thymidylate kinase
MRLCRQRGLPFTLVGRREGSANALVGKLSRLLHEEGEGLTAPASMLVRIAREHQRAQLAASVPSGLVVLDRFILSALALVRLNGLEPGPFLTLLKDVTARAHLHATVFVKCPFEVARQRVLDRGTGGIGQKSVQLLQRIARYLEDDFQSGTLTGQQWLVDNSGQASAAEEQLEDCLLSCLRERRGASAASASDVRPLPATTPPEETTPAVLVGQP